MSEAVAAEADPADLADAFATGDHPLALLLAGHRGGFVNHASPARPRDGFVAASGATGARRPRHRPGGGPVGRLQRALEDALGGTPCAEADAPGPADDTEDATTAPVTRPVRADAALATARADGFAAGLAEGQRRAEAALGGGLADLERLASGLLAAQAVDADALEAPLAAAALALAQALLEAEPALALDTLEPRIARAARLLAAETAPARLDLNPSDAAFARATLAPMLEAAAMTLGEDATLARGDLRLTRGRAAVEDRIAERLERLAAALVDPAPPAADEERDAHAAPRRRATATAADAGVRAA